MKHIHSRNTAIITIVLLCALTACRERTVAFEFRPTPVEGWEPGDTLKFSVDSLPADGTYTLRLGLRTAAAPAYPFRSLWLVVRQHWHNPDTVQTDTVECRLTDRKGDISGNGVSLYQYDIPLKSLMLTAGDRAEIGINHIMRRDVLTGVSAVGIRLEKE